MAAAQDNAPFLLVANDGWHAGVVGIVAGRLKERFAKPSFVAGFEGGMGRGSARSIPGIDIGRMVRAAREQGLIEAGGGHAMAAGFSLMAHQLDRSAIFCERAFAGTRRRLCGGRDLVLDAVSSPAGAGPALVAEIALAGPYGAGNPEPVLGFARSCGWRSPMSWAATHVKVRLAGGDGARLDAIAFRAAGTPLGEGLLKSRGAGPSMWPEGCAPTTGTAENRVQLADRGCGAASA